MGRAVCSFSRRVSWRSIKKNPTPEISIFGQERVVETIRLAKMNLAVHGLAGEIVPSNTYYEDPTQVGIDNSSARVLPAGTLCLSRAASVGYVVVMGVPSATSQDFVNWVCSQDLDHRFLK